MFTLFLACVTETESVRSVLDCDTSFSEDVPLFFSTYLRCVTGTFDGDTVTITSNGLPPHTSPYYDQSDPNWVEWDDRGGDWVQNPNIIATQDYTFRFAVEPVARGITIDDATVDRMAGDNENEYRGENQGLALDGVALFAGFAAPGDDIAEEQYTFDTWGGHPEMTGRYHHHSPNPAGLAVLYALGFTSSQEPGLAEVEIYGMMCDGTAVLGCTELDGSEPDLADEDGQHGHVHDLVDGDGITMLAERYHVHLCADFDDDVYTPELQYYEVCG
jgi:hypothetical protein